MLDGVRDRGRRWISIARLLKLAGWGPLTLGILLNLGIGLLPVGFIVTTAEMLESISVHAGFRAGHTAAWGAVVPAFALAIGAMAAQSALSPCR
jgi:ATP-binding cassette subfamily B protein